MNGKRIRKAALGVAVLGAIVLLPTGSASAASASKPTRWCPDGDLTYCQPTTGSQRVPAPAWPKDQPRGVTDSVWRSGSWLIE